MKYSSPLIHAILPKFFAMYSGRRAALCVTIMLLISLAACGTVKSTESATDESQAAESSADTSQKEQKPLLSESLVQQFEQQIKAEGHPAIVVAVVDGDASEVYGFGALESGEKPDAQTLFEIGSLTKTFTGLLLAEAVESGEVSLDEPVQALLPEFEIPTRDAKTITLESLATQRSGLPRLPGNLDVDANATNPYATYDAEKLKGFLAGYTLPRDPGESYEYSNVGYGLLGYALGQKAGSDYATLVKTQIFEPLSMSSSLVSVSNAESDRLAKGHNGAGDTAANWDFSVLAPTGSIVSDGDDMLRYLKANMGRTDSPLYPAMQLAHQARAEGPSPTIRIGLGWMTLNAQGKDIIWHNGMTGGYASFMGFLADGSRGVVILTNIAKPVDALGVATLLAAEETSAGQETIDMSAQQLDDYVGSYKLAPGFILKVYRDETQLFMQATGQGPLPIFPSAKDEFFVKIAPISVSFERDDAQKVAALILHQNGDQRAPRMTQEEIDQMEAAKTEVELPEDLLKEYAGTYQLTPNHQFSITFKDGKLFAQLTGQPALEIFASAKDHFFYKAVDAQLVFERDDQDNIAALVLHQNGAEQRAPRVEE